MRILFLSRHSSSIRLGHVTETNWSWGAGRKPYRDMERSRGVTLERCLTLCDLLSSVKRIKESKKGGTIARCRSQKLAYVMWSPLVRRTHKKSRSRVERSRGVTLKGCFTLCDLLSSVKKKKVEGRSNNLLVWLSSATLRYVISSLS